MRMPRRNTPQGHADVAQLLLQHGSAAAALRDRKGRLPADCAAAGSAVKQQLQGAVAQLQGAQA
jgi:ankyrin repeat protein